MNDVEKRRQKLLQETRKNYSDKYAPPAIHPRFHAVYDSLYRNTERDETANHSSFFIRLAVAVLLFALFFVMDDRKEQIGTIDSNAIVSEVQKNLLSQ